MSDKPQGAVIEIVEKTNREDPYGVIVPNEVRINGQELLCSADDPVTVHEISTFGNEIVRVTLTLLAKRVEIKSEVTG